MDSVTQIALGASVAELVLGRKIGNKAALIGAVCATLPDLDSFIPYANAVASVTYHRSFSHSLIVLSLISPLIALVLSKMLSSSGVLFKQWLIMVFLVLITHPLLDCFTVYGTQLFWPFINHPYSGSSVFIIDPVYTLPLAIGVLVAMSMHRQNNKRHMASILGLSLSSLYLIWTVGAKLYIEAKVKSQLYEQGIVWDSLLSTPAPFNTVLWRLVIMVEGGYYEAYYSVLDAAHKVDFSFIEDDKHLLEPISDSWSVQRLQWFTHGFYSARRINDDLVISDLRMGVEGAYTFSYRVAEFIDDSPMPVNSTMVALPFRTQALVDVLRRTISPIRG